MSETITFGLPLLQPAQAQKHVTVNEALTRLDGMVQLRLASVTLATPPSSVDEGVVFYVPDGAVGSWAGREGHLALGQGGGWVFFEPKIGWQGWIVDEGHIAVFSGSDWLATPVSCAAHGAAARFNTLTFDHPVGTGGFSITATSIPASKMIFAVSARVVSTLTGSLTSWQLGDGDQIDRYGSGMGLDVGSYAQGLLGTPMTVYTETPLVVSAIGGTFSGGVVRIAAHYFEVDLPAI